MGCFFHRSCLSSQCENYERNFEQWSELQVATYLIVHEMSRSYFVSSIEIRNEGKATEQQSLCFAKDISLNQVRVYHERVYWGNIVSKFWLLRSFSSQLHSKFIANIATEKVSEVRTKQYKTKYFICKVNLNFLHSSR